MRDEVPIEAAVMTEGWINARAAMQHLGRWTNIKAFNRAVHREGIPHKRIGGGRLMFQKSRLSAWAQVTGATRTRTKRHSVERTASHDDLHSTGVL